LHAKNLLSDICELILTGSPGLYTSGLFYDAPSQSPSECSQA